MEKAAQSRVKDYFEYRTINEPPYYFILTGKRMDIEEYKKEPLEKLKAKWLNSKRLKRQI